MVAVPAGGKALLLVVCRGVELGKIMGEKGYARDGGSRLLVQSGVVWSSVVECR